MALYEELGELDIITPIQPQLESGLFRVRPEDGMLTMTGEAAVFFDSSWIPTNLPKDRNCALWHRVYFFHYGLLPRNCFHCYKVVTRPKNLDDLFAILKLQRKMNLPSKCGIEKRPYASHKGHYAAFWYCPMEGGLDGAREHHKLVERAVHRAVGIHTKVILKRACTEFEDKFGPSSEWVYPKEHHLKEDLLDASWDLHTIDTIESTMLDVTRKMDWIDYARLRGDPTAEKYYDTLRNVGIVSTVTYHDTVPEIRDLPDRGQRRNMTYDEFQAANRGNAARLSANE